jgi:hypothetical protein
VKVTKMNIHAHLIPDLLSWRKEFFRLKRSFLDDQLRRSLRGP